MSRRSATLTTFLSEENLTPEAKDFLESLKTYEYHMLDPTLNQRIRLVNTSKEIGDIILSQNMELGNLPEVPLPALDLTDKPALRQFVELGLRRTSRRQYGTPLSFEVVAQLLQSAYFNKNNVSLPEGTIDPASQQQLRFKNIASGGGLYTVEVYYVNFRTEGLAPGTYHYNLSKKALEQVELFPSEADVMNAQEFFFSKNSTIDFAHASGVLVMAGMINRASFKYGNRAIALAYIDTGAIINSVYTASQLLGIGCCGNGGYIDDSLRACLNLRHSSQVILGSVVLGSAT